MCVGSSSLLCVATNSRVVLLQLLQLLVSLTVVTQHTQQLHPAHAQTSETLSATGSSNSRGCGVSPCYFTFGTQQYAKA
jgi:hypothetical protein